MARPERHDADYFPFYAKRGRTLNILQAKFGLEGLGFFTNLLRFLTITPDHHYQIKNPLDQMNLFAEIGISDEKRGIEILDLLAMTGKIDSDLWHKNGVIVSESFIESLEDAYSKRKNNIITIEEIRVNYTGNTYTDELPVQETHIQEDYVHLKGTGNPQRKGKERKGKDIIKHRYGEYNHVLLSDSEKDRLIEEWGDPELNRMIKELDEGIQAKGYKYSDHNLAIRKWKKNSKGTPISKPLSLQDKVPREKKKCPKCGGDIRGSACVVCYTNYDYNGDEI